MMSVAEMVLYLGHHFNDHQVRIVPNVYLLGHEMDLAVVSCSGYLYEVEIKRSLADVKVDLKKEKWRDTSWRSKVRRFYFAMPAELCQRATEYIPPFAGILRVNCDEASPSCGSVYVLRVPCENREAPKLEESLRMKLTDACYFRMWRLLGNRAGDVSPGLRATITQQAAEIDTLKRRLFDTSHRAESLLYLQDQLNGEEDLLCP